MQNAELFRRGIVLPLDRAAEVSLRTNDVSKDTNVRLLEIPGNELFESLWRFGLFREINSRCATLLDDYEEEMVDVSSVEGILSAIDSVAGDVDSQQPEVIEFIAALRTLVQEAITLSRPVLFLL